MVSGKVAAGGGRAALHNFHARHLGDGDASVILRIGSLLFGRLAAAGSRRPVQSHRTCHTGKRFTRPRSRWSAVVLCRSPAHRSTRWRDGRGYTPGRRAPLQLVEKFGGWIPRDRHACAPHSPAVRRSSCETRGGVKPPRHSGLLSIVPRRASNPLSPRDSAISLRQRQPS